jgi:hypothetical protein
MSVKKGSPLESATPSSPPGELPMCQVHCSVNLQEDFQSNASGGKSRRSRHRCIGFHPKSLVLGAPWRSLQGENDIGVPPSPVPADYRMGALAQSPSCTNRKTRTSTSCQQQHTGSRVMEAVDNKIYRKIRKIWCWCGRQPSATLGQRRASPTAGCSGDQGRDASVRILGGFTRSRD